MLHGVKIEEESNRSLWDVSGAAQGDVHGFTLQLFDSFNLCRADITVKA